MQQFNTKVVFMILLVNLLVSLGLVLFANDFQITSGILFTLFDFFIFLSILVLIVYWMILNRSRKNIFIGVLLITVWISLATILLANRSQPALTNGLIVAFILSVLELLLGIILIICYGLSVAAKKKAIYLKYVSMALLLWGGILFVIMLPFCGGMLYFGK